MLSEQQKHFQRSASPAERKEKCDTLKKKLEATTDTKITTAQVDADKVERTGSIDPVVSAGCGSECGTALSGSDDHGGLSGV